ncbi:hypothetical protein BOTBODRAFT_34433 [Botryobasidium botryosum FD-172 SS1]|uniref:Uncharacterized protein n=1 Tax=Botryobasidium botryosum (strain FD-172 SS1) TaxID=930990 RepID=A0A067MCN3_BOTB1|nr:hypothetical protein BOTBODRAFT_34433 [Botryobasidium botryosum FD-172 SS1]
MTATAKQSDHTKSASDCHVGDTDLALDGDGKSADAMTPRTSPTAAPTFSEVVSGEGRQNFTPFVSSNAENRDIMDVDVSVVSREDGTMLEDCSINGASHDRSQSAGVQSNLPNPTPDSPHRCDQSPAFLELHAQLLREHQHAEQCSKVADDNYDAYHHLLRETTREKELLHEAVQRAEGRAAHFEQKYTTTLEATDKKIASLKSKLRKAEEQHASLRDHLQVSDTQEPRQIVSSFQALKRSIANACTRISASATDCIHRDAPDLLLSTHSRSRDKLETLLHHASGLITSPSGEGRPLEDFLDYSLRHLLNRSLTDELFNLFHPNVIGEEDIRITELYEDIYAGESQTSSAHVRTCLFSAMDRWTKKGGRKTWAGDFVKRFKAHAVVPLMEAVCGSWSDDMLTPTQEGDVALLSVALEAWTWHRTIRLKSAAQDFYPLYYDDQNRYNEDWMLLFENHKPISAEPRVMALIGLGLESTRSLGAGKAAEQVCHERAEILTDGFSWT